MGSVATVPTGDGHEYFGVRQQLTIPAPAAGADWTFTLPAGYYYRILAAHTVFTASAAAGNRNPGISLSLGGATFALVHGAAITATQSIDLNYVVSNRLQAPSAYSAASGVFEIPAVWLDQGAVIASTTTGIMAGDQYSAVVTIFDCWDYGWKGQREREHPMTVDEFERLAEVG